MTDASAQDLKRQRIRSLLKFTALACFMVGAVWFFRFTDTGQSITPGRFKEFGDEFDPVWTPLVYIFVYIAGTVLLLPGTLLSFAGAILFGAYLGTLYTWIGATIGATLAFLLARFLGRGFVDQLLKGRLQTIDRRLREHGFTSLLILRLVPLFPFNGLNFGCGLTSIRLHDYVLATTLGILPGTFVYQFLFARFGEKMLQDGFAWSDLLDLQILFAFALFAVFIGLGKWLSNRFRDE